MPRKPRMFLPDVPCHVISRGNNRDACFYSDDDYLFYLECLNDACERHKVAVHAYVLMTNHVHLLMTPSRADGIPKVLQSIGRRYVQYINRTIGDVAQFFGFNCYFSDRMTFYFAIKEERNAEASTNQFGGDPASYYPARK